MKNKITLLFAALMMTLGVSAQTTYEYFEFPEEVSEKVEITSADEFENLDGEWIVIQHNHDVTDLSHQGYYFIINSAIPSGQTYHTTAMNERCSGLAMFQLEKVTDSNETIGYQLKTIHSRTENVTCYVGQFGDSNITTTDTQNSTPAIVNFTRDEQGFMISSSCSKGEYCMYVEQDAEGVPQMKTKSVNDRGTDFVEHAAFKVYKVIATHGTTKKVENATVILTGQGGNTIEGTHTGWSDFYEFVTNADAYGCTLSNAHYDEKSNTITGNIDFPFAVTGDYVQVPVYLHARKDSNKRVSIVDGTLKVVENEEGDENLNSQWYIIPKIEGLKITYALKNVNTGDFIYKSGASTIGLSDQDATYFGLDANATKDAVRFFFAYNETSDYYLAANTDGTMTSGYKWGNSAYNFIVETVSSDNVDFGIQQRYPLGTAFWNAGIVAEENQPTAIRSMANDLSHEFYESEHEVYSAETAITVKSRSNIVVTFNFTNGSHLLNIYGIDIVTEDGTMVLSDYHLGKAGASNKTSKNVYTLKNVPMGEWKLRYFVCNTPKLTDAEGHFLGNNAGYIQVDGASLKLKISDAPTADWAQNTTWYYMLSKDANGTVCAEPAYTDWHNNLKVNNATASKSAAGLWAIVGNDTDGYKFYNRAWGTGYALKTTGADGEARSFMATAGDASLYDIVRHEDGAIYVKVRGDVANNYLNNNNGYLGTWTNGSSLGDEGSRIYLNEVLNTAEFDAGVEPIVATLQNDWAPWKNANTDINTAYNNNSTFASWVLGRQQLAELLNGKVFKFANADDAAPRKDMLLTVNGEGKGAGLTATGNSEDYMQFIDNGDGTFKLFHIATARYLGVPDGAVTTTKSSEAAAYTYTFQDAEHKEQLTFQTSGQTLHLKNVENFIFMNHGTPDVASRWTVFYGEAEAQDLGAVAIEAQEMLERITTDEYLANAGQPGHASQELIEEYKTAIQGLSGLTEVEAKETLEAAMQTIKDAEYIHQYVTALTELSNTGIYGIHCARGPLAYVEGNSTTHLSTPKLNSADDITANVVKNENEQFAILRTENTPAGWYYLYNITTQKFVSKDFTLTENPVCAVNFRDISSSDADYRWEVWFGEILNGEKVDQKLNVNQAQGLVRNSNAGMDAGNKFRIEYAETNEAKTAPALALIEALEAAKAEATTFLNSTPETIGYPDATARTTFENAIVAAASVTAVQNAKTAFVTTTSVVMPEDGKAYKISAWWRNRTWPLTFIAEGEGSYACQKPAYAPVENGAAAVFVCRKVAEGEYAFISDNGYYLGWQAADKGNNTSKDYQVTYNNNDAQNKFKLVKAVIANNGAGPTLTNEDVFGKFNLYGQRDDAWWHYMFNFGTKNFHDAGSGVSAGTAYYGNDAHTVYYTFEEVDYTLNKVTLTTTDANRDELLSGIEFGKTIGTFSAPYATVIPEDVTAYYAEQEYDGGTVSLTPIEEGKALPANQGVILIGEVGVNSVMFIPATEETPADLSANTFSNSATSSVVMESNDYILANGGQGIGFYHATPSSTLKQGKAFFRLPAGAGASSLVLRFGGNTTDIDAVTTGTPSDDELIYDIYGRRVIEVKKGNIYIKNGKKFIVK